MGGKGKDYIKDALKELNKKWCWVYILSGHRNTFKEKTRMCTRLIKIFLVP
jgi:hypothetical protein